jgi:rRNA-processing protein EBP2
MAKSKLKSAIERHKGRDIALEKQRKLEKAAHKRKQAKAEQQEEEEEEEEDEVEGAIDDKDDPEILATERTGEDAGWETDEDDEEEELVVRVSSNCSERIF